MENLNDTNDYKWIPAHLTDKKEKIISDIKEEEKGGLLSMEGKTEDWRNNYGYSWPGVNNIQAMCLEKICELYTAHHSHPSVLDVGAGYGLMTWKMMIAGGSVTAIEKQEAAANLLSLKIWQAKLILIDCKDTRNLSQLRIGDMCNYNLDVYKPDLYDVTWSGYNIHFETPAQTTAYLENLYKVTKPGGYAYASVHTVYSSEDQKMIEYFLAQKSKKALHPGFLVGNQIHHYRYDQKQKINVLESEETTGPYNPAPENMSPGILHDGIYKGKKVKFNPGKPLNGTANFHMAYHFFEPESLSSFFEKAGFEVEDAFFYGKGGKLSGNEKSEKEKLNNMLAVGIAARKPASREEKR
jgi:SAM-dependent methyltransferase